MPNEIRPASAADEPAITQIRRETWFAAYAQIIDPEIIARVTAPRDDHASAAPPPHRTSLVAVAPQPQPQPAARSEAPQPQPAARSGAPQPQPAARSEAPQPQPAAQSEAHPAIRRANAETIVGYASFGPERAVASAFASTEAPPAPFTPAGLAGETGELYALYVAPAHWSTGAGRALTDAVLDGLRAAGYRRVVLWTLIENARARRFYAKAGFAPDGATNLLPALGHVEELRYTRDL